MGKFKVGDRVRSLVTEGRFTKGAFGTIIRVNSRDNPIYMVKWDYPDGVMGCYLNAVASEYELELVGNNTVNELEELVKKANEGFVAAKRIREEFSYKTEISVDGLTYRGYSGFKMDWNIRIKQQTFEPFSVKNWLVKQDELGTHVGCQCFNSKNLANGLNQLIRHNKSANHFGASHQLMSTKDGIKYGEHLLSWEDAEKILNALEKVGV